MDTKTVDVWLADAVARLTDVGIATARLDCLILLEDMTGKERSWLLAHPEDELESYQVEKLESWLLRRLAHEPLAYIRGKSEFYGREFAVNAHTLEPRPETEPMVELLKQLTGDWRLEAGDNKLLLVDVGTGSGCIAITAALELPGTKVYAIDIDEKCLKIARQNAQILGANVTFLHGSLLEPLQTGDWRLDATTSAILANLPYVPDGHTINLPAQHEPKHAIFGGVDGLDLYRQLFAQLRGKEQGMWSKWVLTESLPFQHTTLTQVAADAGYSLFTTSDFIQVFELA